MLNRMPTPTERASAAEMASAAEVARWLGLSREKFNALARDPSADFPVPYIFSTSGRGWRFFARNEVAAWLESKREKR